MAEKLDILRAWDEIRCNRWYVHEGKGVSKMLIKTTEYDAGAEGTEEFIIKAKFHYTDGSVQEEEVVDYDGWDTAEVKSNAWRLMKEWHFNTKPLDTSGGSNGFAGGNSYGSTIEATPPSPDKKLVVQLSVDDSGPKVVVRCCGLDGSLKASVTLRPEIDTLVALFQNIEGQLSLTPDMEVEVIMPDGALMNETRPDAKVRDIFSLKS